MAQAARTRRIPILAAFAAALAGLCAAPTPPTSAQPPQPAPPPAATQHPPLVRRIVQVFDFEEPDNPDPIPRLWFRAQDEPPARSRPGFLPFNKAVFDFTVAASGHASVHLPTRGGSTSLRLLPGAIPVFPGADYAITAKVHTTPLVHARAFLTARLLDRNLRPIPDSQVRTPPILAAQAAAPAPDPAASRRGGGGWTTVSLELLGLFDNAAFLQLDLELLQPEQFLPAAPLDKFQVWLQDMDGAAWFDDVTVEQVPRVELSTTTPGNIILAPDKPVLRILIQDMVADQIHARLTIRDVDDKTVVVTPLDIPPGGRALDLTPDLPALGFYRGTLEVLSAEAPIGRADATLLWLPAPAVVLDPTAAPALARGPDRARFGLIADNAPSVQLPLLPDILRRTGAGFVFIPLWPRPADKDAAERALTDLTPVLDQLLAIRQEITVSIPSIPVDLAQQLRLEPTAPLLLAHQDQMAWLPVLLPLLDRYGQRIPRWQIGRTGDAPVLIDPDLYGAVAVFEAAFSRVVPGPIITIPWRAGVPLPSRPTPAPAAPAPGQPATDPPSPHAPPAPTPGTPPAAVTMLVPASGADTAMRDLAAAWNAIPAPAPELTIVPEAVPFTPTGARQAVNRLVKRTVDFWGAMAESPPGGAETPARIALAGPGQWLGARRTQLLPSPELAAFRSVIDRLAGRRVVGQFPVAPGIRCDILADTDPHAGPASGALIAWNESAPPDRAVLHPYVADSPLTLVDIFGNRTPLVPDAPDSPTCSVPLTATPVFIEGINPNLARFAATFRVEPAFVPAVVTQHEHSIVLENPWPMTVSGDIQIARSGPTRSWTIEPSAPIAFSIPPRAVCRLPFAFSFGPAEEAGGKDLVAVVRLNAERNYPPLRLATRIEIGLQDIDMSTACALSPTDTGPDAILTVTVTNKSDQPRTLVLEAAAAGFPRQRGSISDLDPGTTAVKRFIFKNAAKTLSGKRIRISLTDVDSPDRLNMSAQVP